MNSEEIDQASLTYLYHKQLADADFSRWRLDVNEILQFLEKSLKNMIYDPENGTWFRLPGTEPLMNEEGVHMIVNTVSMFVNKFTVMSNLTKENIINACRELNIALVDLLFYNYEKYQIKKENLDLIVLKVVRFVEFSLYKALNAGERESFTKAEHIQRVYAEPMKKKGFLAIFGKGGGSEE